MQSDHSFLTEVFEDIFSKNRKTKEKPPLWDSFLDPPSRRATGSATSWKKLGFILKVLKLLTYLIVFVCILMTAIISKLSYVLMVAQLDNDASIRVCSNNEQQKYFLLKLPREESIAWVWGVILAFACPEFFTFLRALRICIFKGVNSPTLLQATLVILFEMLHVIGLAVLTFTVLPKLGSIKALMLCNCVCFVPALLNVPLTATPNGRFIVLFTLNFLTLVAQISGFLVWPSLSKDFSMQIVCVPLILVSLRWWENYVNSYPSIASLVKAIRHSRSRYQTYLFLSPVKVAAFALMAFVLHGCPLSEYFKTFSSLLKPHEILIIKDKQNSLTQTTMTDNTSFYADKFVIQSEPEAMCIVVILQIVSSYLCYVLAKFACKIKIQQFSFSVPLCLVSPMTVVMATMLLQFRANNVCIFQGYLPNYLTLRPINSKSQILEIVLEDDLWLWILWWISQLLVTRHIWHPKNERNAPTEKLFVCPWYCGLLVDQCILLNRRIVNWNEEHAILQSDTYISKAIIHSSPILEVDKIPQLIVCATMWHETQEEMMGFLKSIIRLDEDQCARRMAKIYINGGKPDDEYYELETNIFFDDAFVTDEKFCENARNPPLNEYVKILINIIEKAAYEIYGVDMKIKPPVKIETPYGGRLVWTLPGRSKIITHLKNKDKIRHKKRWSQVMYMYYLLGYRIMDLENMSVQRKSTIAENTFLLALDGDIDFQPQAVQLLVDRMKAIEELGAACGRIHPVGRGPMVWYQIFEYAIGHWLQKATEHVIGCVLCSPGCFSLFRGSALMQNSVMKKYTAVSREPMHYVQYDQGEDRWLCTLILKQGLRVEYSAASDAYTHSPEMFNEFYNQRRRWVPSTIANIFDLLVDADLIVKNNSSISMPYISYQAMLMVGTILGPGTIFLMLVGSLVTVFSISIWTSFLWNFIPVLCFILSCIYLKQKFQLLLAFLISTMYCLLMMAVLIGIIIQMIEDGPLAPASMFFLLVFLQIFIAGLVHPQEMAALIYGFIYYITIPSMYMLLMIYSVFNMNDVSWGTREAVVKEENGNNIFSKDDIEKCEEYLPGWVNDPILVDSELGEISLREKRFWKELIAQYLKPLFHTVEKKAEIAERLRELRNMFAFAFVMINSIFVLTVFLLQLKKDYLHVEWPIDPFDFITYDNTNSQIYIYRRYKELDPIGLCFVIFFGMILLIQFLAMFIHRFATFSQLLAATQINWFRSANSITDEEAAQEIRGNAVNIARQLQRPKPFNGNDVGLHPDSLRLDLDDKDGNVRRQTIFKLHQNHGDSKGDYTDLPRNFEKNFWGKDEINTKDVSMSRKSVMMLAEKRFAAKPCLTQQDPARTDYNKTQATHLNAYENSAYVTSSEQST